MKKIILSVLFLLGTVSFSFAQKTISKTETKKETKKTDEKGVKKSTGVNKDGSPDMRIKANKTVKEKPKEPVTVAPIATTKKTEPAPPKVKVRKVENPVTTTTPVVTPKVTPVKVTPKTTPTTTAPVVAPKVKPATVTPAVTPVANTADKVIGKDAKG